MGDISVSNCPKCGTRGHCCKCQAHEHEHAVAPSEPRIHPMLARRLAAAQAAQPEPEKPTQEPEKLARFVELTAKMEQLDAEIVAITREATFVDTLKQQLEKLPKLDLPSREDNLETPRTPEQPLSPKSPDIPPPKQHMELPAPEPLASLPAPTLPKKTRKLKKKGQPSAAFLRLTQGGKAPKTSSKTRSAGR